MGAWLYFIILQHFYDMILYGQYCSVPFLLGQDPVGASLLDKYHPCTAASLLIPVLTTITSPSTIYGGPVAAVHQQVNFSQRQQLHAMGVASVLLLSPSPHSQALQA